jgi:hypothetical protein
MNQAQMAQKLQRLGETDDDTERNALALELSEAANPRVFDALVLLIQRPDLKNRRGTLVYCLEKYDCSSVVGLLLNLAETGNFEVASQAQLILHEQALR